MNNRSLLVNGNRNKEKKEEGIRERQKKIR
jgi:hypothetical protein